jgi:hypothetical protein
MRALFLLVLLLTSLGCGAGIIGGVVASNRRPGAQQVRTVSIDRPYFAYVGQQGEPRLVTISNYQAPATGRLRVAIRVPLQREPAPFADFEQSAQVVEVRDNATRIGFVLNTVPLTAALLADGRDLTAADLTAQLLVAVDDVEVVPPIPLTAYRVMQATLEPSRKGSTTELLSTAGGSEFKCRLRGFPAASRENFTFEFVVFDPAQAGATLSISVGNVRVEPIAGTDELMLRAVAPPNAFPCLVQALVHNPLAGLSQPLAAMYYRAEIGFALPRASSTDGGARVLLVGSGLVPLTFPDPQRPAEPDYDRIELWVEKGGRRTQVPSALIQRRPPSLSRLSFELPPSPDGRRGLASLWLRADLRSGGVGEVIATEASNLLLYGDSQPGLGPRGAVLPTAATHVAFGDLEGNGGGADAVACFGTQPNVQLLVSNDNGMLSRFGAPLIAGSASALERSPRRLIVADFGRRGFTDVLVLNTGDAVSATHTALVGQALPAAPLAFGGPVLSASSVRTSAQGDFDGNGLLDVVVLPSNTQARPELYLAVGDRQTPPRFVVSILTQVAEVFDVVEAADLDRDGKLDLAFARGGLDMALFTLYGAGDGTFVPGESLALTRRVPGYIEDANSPAVGLHACGDSRVSGLALVLQGVGTQVTPAAMAVLEYTGGRHFELPQPNRVEIEPGRNFVRSLAADLDADGVRELLLASQEGVEASLRHFAWRNNGGAAGFVAEPVPDAGAEPLVNVRGLAFGAAGQREGTEPAPAVFVVHSYALSLEAQRITTLFTQRAGGAVRLLPPDASLQLAFPIEGIAVGSFRAGAAGAKTADVAVASAAAGVPRGVQFLSNDGFGTMVPGVRVDVDLLPRSLMTVPRAGGDFVVGLDRGRVLRVIRPGAPAGQRVHSLALDPYLPPSLRTLDLEPTAKLAVGDVDGDGTADVVALLLFQNVLVPQEELGQLLVLFGHGAAAVTDLPFVVPDAAVRTTPTHGEARDLALDELAPNARTRRLLEVAVVVGGNVNHVRFFAVDRADEAPAVRGLRRSFTASTAQALLAGDRPLRVVTADIDADGIVELGVYDSATNQLRLFTNTSLVGDDVDVASFRPVAGGAPVLPPNTTQIVLRDLTGDALPDLLVLAATVQVGNPISNAVQHYFGTGTGQFINPVLVSPVRTGDLVWSSARLTARDALMRMTVGEVNGDDAPDVLIGWPTVNVGQRNFLVLFGGAR